MNLSVLVPTATPHATPCSVIEDDLWFSQRPAVVQNKGWHAQCWVESPEALRPV